MSFHTRVPQEDAKKPAPDFRVPDSTDCSPQRPGSLSHDDRALLVLGDEGGPGTGAD